LKISGFSLGKGKLSLAAASRTAAKATV